MRVIRSLVALVATVGLTAGTAWAGKVEVKNVHLCCGQCVKIAKDILAKVEGVSEANASQDTMTVTFTAKDATAATAGVKALLEGGLFGKATEDGKDIMVEMAGPAEGQKANEVSVKGVHVCCKMCQKAINGIFKDAKVAFAGTGTIKDLKISGKDLDKKAVLDALRNAGFNGKVD